VTLYAWIAKELGSRWELMRRNGYDEQRSVATVYRNGAWIVRKGDKVERSGKAPSVEAGKKMAKSMAIAIGVLE
jgi:hypothetical protein